MSDESNNKIKMLTQEEKVTTYASMLAAETVKLIDSTTSDENLRHRIKAAYIEKFVRLLVFNAVTDRPKHITKREEMLDHNINGFRELKGRVQEAVAGGFQGAMVEYSGRSVEYYCTVAVVPDPVNKVLC